MRKISVMGDVEVHEMVESESKRRSRREEGEVLLTDRTQRRAANREGKAVHSQILSHRQWQSI
jgi:hypothetical protein